MADTVTYTVVVNQPGSLPESEPYEVETLHEARCVAANLIRTSLTEYATDAQIAGMTANEIDQILMAAYDLGPDGGHLWLPGEYDSGYLVDVIPTW